MRISRIGDTAFFSITRCGNTIFFTSFPCVVERGPLCKRIITVNIIIGRNSNPFSFPRQRYRRILNASAVVPCLSASIFGAASPKRRLSKAVGHTALIDQSFDQVIVQRSNVLQLVEQIFEKLYPRQMRLVILEKPANVYHHFVPSLYAFICIMDFGGHK